MKVNMSSPALLLKLFFTSLKSLNLSKTNATGQSEWKCVAKEDSTLQLQPRKALHPYGDQWSWESTRTIFIISDKQ